MMLMLLNTEKKKQNEVRVLPLIAKNGIQDSVCQRIKIETKNKKQVELSK